MRKITCHSSTCGAVFNFYNEKNPNAKLVKCPMCGNVQTLDGGDFAPMPTPTPVRGGDDVDDWRPQPREIPKPKPMEEDIGWLIIHDEYTKSFTFKLLKGVNRIGRESETTDQDVSIRIKTEDQYMSRHHCDIEVRWRSTKNIYEYVLSDKEYPRKPHSKNGTFVNGSSRLNRRDEVLLDDGDTVQVGRTKLVLKLPSAVSQQQDAESSVREMDFFKTIIQQ
jgi:pSer/pThr/pTyr-binding forkhead associated (FHA) protein